MKEMNSWSENATKGLIKKIISCGPLDKAATFVLANAKELGQLGLTFLKYWEKRDLHLINGKTVLVPFMRKLTLTSFYQKFDGFKVLQILYAKKGLDLICFSMYFNLPDEKDGLSFIVEKLNADYGLFNQCLNSMRRYFWSWWFPNLRSGVSFRLQIQWRNLDIWPCLLCRSKSLRELWIIEMGFTYRRWYRIVILMVMRRGPKLLQSYHCEEEVQKAC